MSAHPFSSLYGHEHHFRWRGESVSRLEAFSDAVFGFAVTLLIVSGEVPRNFDQLLVVLRGFPAFAICFALLVTVWFCHYQFFRRFGLQTAWTIVLNACLLFFVLLYVYPLKYLFTVVAGTPNDLTADQARVLFVIYGLGYAAVFMTLALLYGHAWAMRERLELDPFERLKTVQTAIGHLAMVAVGVASAVLALLLPERWIGSTGVFYFVIPVYYTVAGYCGAYAERRLLARLANAESVAAPGS